MTSQLDGASLEVLLRGSFIPTFDELTLDFVGRWESQRDVTIDVQLSQDWRELVLDIARDRRGADLAAVHGNQPHVLSRQLVDVSDLAESIGDALGGWADVARSTCVVDGVWRAVPWSTTRHALVVRTDLLNDVGAVIPSTYDELLDTAVRLHDAGAPPIGITMSNEGPIDSSAIAYGMLWSFGGHEVSSDGRVALDSSETHAALSYFEELSAVNLEGALHFSHPDNNDAYLGGDVSLTQNPSSILLKALELELPLTDHTVHVGLPAGPAGQFQLPEMNSLAIFDHSREPIACMDLIAFLNTRDVLIDRARESLAFHAPLVLGIDDDPQMPWRTDERLAGLSSTGAEGRMPGWPRPPSLEAGLVYQNNSIVKMFKAVGTGEMTVDESLRAASEELRVVYET